MAIAFVGNATGNAINGGTVTLNISASARIVNTYVGVAVTLGTSKNQTLTCTTSSGFSYTQIVATATSSSARFGYFRRFIASTGETAITVAGTGGSTDSTATTAILFSGVDVGIPEDATATSTTGSGTTPDSPSITVASAQTAIISAFGAQISDATVTAPTSYVNATNTNASDTWSATTGQAWVTYSSTATIDPTSWSNLTSASWVAATIALRVLFTGSTGGLDFAPAFPPYYGTREIVGY